MKHAPFLIAAGVVAGVSAFPVRPVIVTGNSMAPTLHHLQFALASRDVTDLKRGDVVVLDTPSGTAVKRIALLEGDSVVKYLWKGKWILPVTDRMRQTLERGKAPRHVTRIPKGYIYVAGDNQISSFDSRNYGPLPVSAVKLRIGDLPDVSPKVPGGRYTGRAYTVGSA